MTSPNLHTPVLRTAYGSARNDVRDPSDGTAGNGRDDANTSDAVARDEMDDAFVRSIFPVLHRAAWKMTGDPASAEDLVQETLLAAYQAWHSFDGRSSRSTWIHGILIRQTRKYYRSTERLRRRIRRYVFQSDRKTIENASDTALARSEWNQSVWADVAALPRKQAEAVLLHFGQQLTYEETADALRCAVGTAKSRVHHGLKRLRESQTRITELDHE